MKKLDEKKEDLRKGYPMTISEYVKIMKKALKYLKQVLFDEIIREDGLTCQQITEIKNFF